MVVYTDVMKECGLHDPFVQVNSYCFNRSFIPIILFTETKRCSLPLIKDFVNSLDTAKGLEISSQRLSVDPDEEDEVFIGSYMLFNCKSGFQSSGNNLNVTCNANGQWSTFPICRSTSTTTITSSTNNTN